MRLARKHKRDLLAECIVQTKIKNSQHFPILVQMFKDAERKRDDYVEPQRRQKKERKNKLDAASANKKEERKKSNKPNIVNRGMRDDYVEAFKVKKKTGKQALNPEVEEE